ncbi:SDR family oxidoreductase [Gottfriedia sp. S16(2024)]|uniref:SDR family oxidoreductase n=1 Tax=Gottfriedia sp. S16(2024) TaxID=3162883 RepID=UPI003D211E08
MKIVVVGGTGFIGTKIVSKLRETEHEIIVASPSLGVNTITGEGLVEVLMGTDVVIDVTNSPSYEDNVVLDFFETSTRNILAAEKITNVKHHVHLSIVGTDGLLESAYFRGKMAQEELIKDFSIPYTIVRTTQFFDFILTLTDLFTDGDTIRLPDSYNQAISSEDAAEGIVDFALSTPVNGIVNLAGPDRKKFADYVKAYLESKSDIRKIEADEKNLYFGAKLGEFSLVPTLEETLHTAPTHFKDWLKEK